MVSHCMQQGWITSSKAQIQNTLSMLVADRVDAGGDRKQLDALDLTDIRILTHALLQVIALYRYSLTVVHDYDCDVRV